jgi:hypothetical protein
MVVVACVGALLDFGPELAKQFLIHRIDKPLRKRLVMNPAKEQERDRWVRAFQSIHWKRVSEKEK